MQREHIVQPKEVALMMRAKESPIAALARSDGRFNSNSNQWNRR